MDELIGRLAAKAGIDDAVAEKTIATKAPPTKFKP
jgi:hypothetical protein